MQNILSKRSQRQLAILDFLTTNKGWTNISKLSENLNCSYQSLSSDIKYLNEIIEPFSIITSQKYGVKILIPPNQTIGLLYQKLLTDSFEFKLLETLFFDENTNLETLSKRLYSSTSTLTRTFSRLRKSLAPFEMGLNSSPLNITGNELTVRYFFLNYFQERYTNQDCPFPKEQQDIVISLLKTILNELGFTLSFAQFQRLKVFALVSLTRIMSNHQIELPAYIRPELEKISLKIMNDKKYIKQLNKTFSIDFNTTTICQLFVNFSNPATLISVADLALNLTEQKMNKINKIKNFLDLFITGFNVKLPAPDNLVYSLFNLDLLFVEHDYLFFNKHRQFAKNINEIAPIYTQHFSQILEDANPFEYAEITKDFKFELFHTILTKWPGLIGSLSQTMDLVSVGIFGEFDNLHSRFIADLLNEHFAYCATFTPIHANSLEVAKEISKDYDLIITNFPNTSWLSLAAYTIQVAPSAEDLIELRSVISNLSVKKRLY